MSGLRPDALVGFDGARPILGRVRLASVGAAAVFQRPHLHDLVGVAGSIAPQFPAPDEVANAHYCRRRRRNAGILGLAIGGFVRVAGRMKGKGERGKAEG